MRRREREITDQAQIDEILNTNQYLRRAASTSNKIQF